MRKNWLKFLPVVVCGAFLLLFPSVAGAQITIGTTGKSGYRLVVPAAAPDSVQNAAQELQKCIELSLGVRLSLQKDDEALKTPFISLGNTEQAKAAGVESAKLRAEAFRIVTKNGNLFILGPDTSNGAKTSSNGTAHGIYTFLEDYLDVRWLMPGELGRDVPPRRTLVLEAIDRTETPEFSWRHLTHLWDYANAAQTRSIQQWGERQKLGGSTWLSYDHNWWPAVNDNPWNTDVDTPAVKALYAAHPEWFAMDATGKRPYPQSHFAKLETTNPEFVRWFAEKAIQTMKAGDLPRTFSLSPSDGNLWSQSLESKALFDPSPTNLFNAEAPPGEPGVSSLILKWYHDVAQIVAKEYPEGHLTGYIYGAYVYPPTKVDMKLPDNFSPVVATIGDGYSLYNPKYRSRFTELLDSWAKVAPKDWFYYDFPAQMLRQHDDEIGDVNFPGSTGIVTPAAPDILNTVFSALHRDKLKGAYMYGVPSWSNAALANYVIAKLEWDPTLNAEKIQSEWLRRAYGPKAGAVMEQFYGKLNGWLGAYYQQQLESAPSLLTLAMLKDVWAAHYPELEKLFLQAAAQDMTEAQRQRLELIGENLIVLQWRLRNSGFLPADLASPLRRDDAQISALLTKENPAFPLFPGATGEDEVSWTPRQGLPWKVLRADVAESIPAGVTAPSLADGRFLLYCARDGDIRITPQRVTQGAYFASFRITDQRGELVSSGILNTATPIVFSAKAGSAYTLYIPLRKAVNYQLRVENAALATGSLHDGELMLSGRAAPVSVFYAPQNTSVGVFQDGEAVLLKKPYSGSAASAVMGEAYTNVRVLESFDEGWKFSPDPQNDGLARGVLKADFDDSQWKSISPLDWWQMQGFPNYHGAAWYRIRFHAAPLPENDRARLYFGAVDGHVKVYLNGQPVFERALPRDYKGWDQPFSSNIGDYVREENTLVVQVTSKSQDTASGIIKGVATVAGTRR